MNLQQLIWQACKSSPNVKNGCFQAYLEGQDNLDFAKDTCTFIVRLLAFGFDEKESSEEQVKKAVETIEFEMSILQKVLDDLKSERPPDEHDGPLPEGCIPITPGSSPPPGWIMVQISDQVFWVDPKTLHKGEPVSQLSPEQEDRIRRIYSVLQGHSSEPVEKWLDNFRRDHHPEGEIRMWEIVAKVYEAELLLRPKANRKERHLLYGVLVTAANTPDKQAKVGVIMSSFPAAKGLANLERVIEHYSELRADWRPE